MKNLLLFSAAIGFTLATTAQTNRISHFSHSGKISTLDIFNANDNMGLGCGSSMNKEHVPPPTSGLNLDSSFKDTSETKKVCVPPAPPRRGMSLERKFNLDSMLAKPH